MQISIGSYFPVSFGQTQCSSRFRFPRQTTHTSSANVSSVGLETTHSTSRSSHYDQWYYSVSFTMVDEYQSHHSGNFYPSSRSQHIPLYGRQSLWMGSSSRADETIISWSLDGRPIPAPYQHIRNDGHTLSTGTSHNIYSPFLCHDFHRQHNGGLLYQQARWNSFSQPLSRSMGDTQFLSGTRHRNQSSHPWQI